MAYPKTKYEAIIQILDARKCQRLHLEAGLVDAAEDNDRHARSLVWLWNITPQDLHAAGKVISRV